MLDTSYQLTSIQHLIITTNHPSTSIQHIFFIHKQRIMATRKANAVWEGGLEDGKGKMSLGSGAFEGNYSFKSRFEDGSGTNPEELIGAAHAGVTAWPCP